jgi:hypothetical protein
LAFFVTSVGNTNRKALWLGEMRRGKNAIHFALSVRNSDPDHHFDRVVQPLLIAIGTIATPDLGV